MTRRASFGVLVLLIAALALGADAAQAKGSSKVQVCHIPPGNPENFHTITVSEKALEAHLAHGDLPGDCFASCSTLCDDGNACTVDACDEETETCFADHPPVDCDDGNLCTTDSCDPSAGCQSAPIVCDDGDLCTVDACSSFDGECTATPKDCGPDGLCLPETGECDFPCDGITCEPIDQCHAAGECVLPGECQDGPPLPDGTPCDDGDPGTVDDRCTGGTCAGTGSLTAFVTSGTYTGDLVTAAAALAGYGGADGLDAADAICNHLAGQAGLAGTYKAWLSISAARDPESTFNQATVPYVRTDGAQVASSWADLTDAALSVPINLDENQLTPVGIETWTATNPLGGYNNLGSCGGWSQTAGVSARYGRFDLTDSRWTEWREPPDCATARRLYCFQQ